MELDAVKGQLVVLMVLYHWLNYFVTIDGAVLKYLRFITPSFIFVTGFLITSVYMARYRVGDWTLHRRLLVRGLKLVVLFTALNLGAQSVIGRNHDGAELGIAAFIASATSIYVWGDGRGAAFEVLVPIGYLLVGSSVLLWVCRIHRHFLPLAWLASLGGVYALKAGGRGSDNLELLSMGLLGMVLGHVRLETLDRALRWPMGWLGAYAVYLIGLNLYDVRFELQMVGLILNMGLLYASARALGHRGIAAGAIIVLGQYSLLAYVGQIAWLQILVRAARQWELGVGACLALFGAALVLTYLTVVVTRECQRRSALLDRMYRLVFA
jgi:hypothetical protein